MLTAPFRRRAVPTVQKRAWATLEGLSLFVPARIANEDIGDAIEVIDHLTKIGSPPWQIYLKVVSTVGWVSVNAIREITSAFLGKSKARSK